MNKVCRNVLIKEANFNSIKHVLIDFIGESYIDRVLSIALDQKQIVHKIDISQTKLAKALETELSLTDVTVTMINTIDNIQGRINVTVNRKENNEVIEETYDYYFLTYDNEIKDILL